MQMKSEDSRPCWFNGQLCLENALTFSLQDPAWLYGATVFTTLRVYDKTLRHPWTAWSAHIERMQRSLQTFDWQMPEWGAVQQGAETLAAIYPVLRLTVFPDGRSLITGRSLPSQLTQLQTQGVIVWVTDSPDYSRPFPGHKTGNYLGCWLALQAAQKCGAQEAILTNAQGHWLESSTGNLWGWCDGAWWTPPLASGILPGVVRSHMEAGLRRQDSSVITQPWEPAQVERFTTLAYTNSVVGVVPIRRILRRTEFVDYNPDYEKLRQLASAWRLGAMGF